MALFTNAQSFYLGTQMSRQGGPGAYNLTSTLEQAALLEDVILGSSAPHMITDITLAGQSVWASNQPAPSTAFAFNSWMGATGHRSLSVPLASRQQVVISGNSNNPGGFGGAPAGGVNVSCAVGTAPIDPDQVVPVNDLGGEAMSYIVGLGQVQVPAAGTAQLVATIRRPCMLGALMLDFDGFGGAVINDLTVESITINNVEMLSSIGTQAGEISFQALVSQSSDVDGKIIGFEAPLNGQVAVTVRNYDAANPANIAGCIFTLPMGGQI
jgi:hypothetical protein